MYGLVPYNISPIQQAIQYGHAVVEYCLQFAGAPDFERWARRDKTFIILNGLTTNLSFEKPGALNVSAQTLSDHGVATARFHEPDLGDQLTAVVFLVDERVWDKKNWPDYDGVYSTNFEETWPDSAEYSEWLAKFSEDRAEAEHIAWLREFLRNFRLA
jgi:hypothetical protein